MVAKIRYLPGFIKKDLPNDVSGKVFVITGTTSGTGFIAAKTAALLGGEVVMLNRNSSRVTTMLEELKKEAPEGKFVTIACDLQDFSSVKKAAQDIKSKYSKIYCLVNNAGILGANDEATKDGYDIQMQTNHLSHFLLTAELLPLLEKEASETGDARIVSHSSVTRTMTKNGLEEKYFQKNGGNLGGDGGSMLTFSGPRYHRYHQTKLANAVFSQGLHNKLTAKSSNVRAVCCDPGVSATNMTGGMAVGRIEVFVKKFFVNLILQSPEDGSMGLLLGMMGPDAKSGNHYGPKGMRGGKPVPAKLMSYETDPKSIDMLWRTSEKATGIIFTI